MTGFICVSQASRCWLLLCIGAARPQLIMQMRVKFTLFCRSRNVAIYNPEQQFGHAILQIVIESFKAFLKKEL